MFTVFVKTESPVEAEGHYDKEKQNQFIFLCLQELAAHLWNLHLKHFRGNLVQQLDVHISDSLFKLNFSFIVRPRAVGAMQTKKNSS